MTPRRMPQPMEMAQFLAILSKKQLPQAKQMVTFLNSESGAWAKMTLTVSPKLQRLSCHQLRSPPMAPPMPPRMLQPMEMAQLPAMLSKKQLLQEKQLMTFLKSESGVLARMSLAVSAKLERLRCHHALAASLRCPPMTPPMPPRMPQPMEMARLPVMVSREQLGQEKQTVALQMATVSDSHRVAESHVSERKTRVMVAAQTPLHLAAYLQLLLLRPMPNPALAN